MIPVFSQEHYQQRTRLLTVIRLAEQRGWKHTLQQAQETFYLLETGKIATAF